jgi:deazaflavin-dependent oxidoreductase (nitroreductase family)
MSHFNDRVIAEFRTNNGRVHTGGFGTSLVLLHTRGAKTGAERVTPAMSLRDGDDWLVVASAKGAPRDPAWAVNLRAHPDMEIEAVVNGAAATIAAHAAELDGDEGTAGFARFVRAAPAFGAYQRNACRQLPVFRLTARHITDTPDNSSIDRKDTAPMTENTMTENTKTENTKTENSGAGNAKTGSIGPDDPRRDLAVRRPDTDERLPHYGVVGDNYTILLTGADTGGRYALIDMHIPPEGGPPPHRHDFEEMFHVLDGEFEVTFRGQRSVVRAGETINIPARAPHFFHNSSGQNARVLCMISPPGLEEYFTLWGQPLPTRTTAPNLTEEESRQRLQRAVGLGADFAIENLPLHQPAG